MAAVSFAPQSPNGQRISLAYIDTVVSARLGPTRGLGKSQPQCFNRQVAMYLASQVGRWSTTVIGRFYSGRDHSTVVHAIQRIEAAREIEPELDVLLSDLKSRILAQPSVGSKYSEVALPIQRPAPRDSDMHLLAKEFASKVREIVREELRDVRNTQEVASAPESRPTTVS